MNQKLPILAPSQVELLAWLRANRWINPEHVQRVLKPQDFDAGAPMLLALPGWNLSPTISDPRGILQRAHSLGVQVLVLERAAFKLTPSVTVPPLPAVRLRGCIDTMAELELAERFSSESG